MKDILAKLTLIENAPVKETFGKNFDRKDSHRPAPSKDKKMTELRAGDKYGSDATAIGNGEMNQPVSEETQYTPATPYGVRYIVFAARDQRAVTKEAWFKTKEAMERGVVKIKNLDNFYEIRGYHYPDDQLAEVSEFNDFDAPDDRQKADNGAFSTTGAPCPESKIDEATQVSTFKKVAKEVNEYAKSQGYKLVEKNSSSYTWTQKLAHGTAYFEIMWGDTDYMYWAEGELKKNGKKESWNSGTDQPEDIMSHAQEYMQNDDEEPEYQPEEPDDENDGELDEHIVKTGSQYELKSHTGKNLGKFKSHKAAAKHEGEVEWFKSHPKESVNKMKTNEQEGVFKYVDSLGRVEATITMTKNAAIVEIPDRDIKKRFSSLIRADEFLEDYDLTRLDDGIANEGLGKTIKKGVKSLKRGMSGWSKGALPDNNPKDLVKRNKAYDTDTAKMLRGDPEKDSKWTGKHSPQGLQNRVLDRELKKRGETTKESKENKMKSRKIVKESLTYLENITDPGLEKVLRHFGKEVKDFMEGGDLADDLYHVLYDYYFDEMPYGTKKARTGDPYEWIGDRLDKELNGSSTAHPSDQAQFDTELGMGEGAAGDIGGDVGSGNDISPLSQVDEDEIDLDDLDEDEDLDEALTPAQQAKMAELRAKNNASPTTIGRNAIPPKAAPYNPFAGEKNDRSGDLAFNQQASFQGYGTREGLGEEELDETFLVEDNEGLITEILEEHGLDHGLDFFFDEGLVAIGKSTARVIINALKADPRIKATPSFGRIDGEEVQIAFNKESAAEPSRAEINNLATEPEYDGIDESLDHSEVAHLLAKAVRVMNSAKTIDQLRSAEKYAQLAYKKIKGTESGFGANFERNMGIYGDIQRDLLAKEKEIRLGEPVTEEDDALNDMRRLSGLPEKELDESGCEICGRGSCTRSFHSLSDQEDFDAKTGKYAPDEEIEDTDDDMEESEEGEYVNAPDPTVHTSTTDMINRGDDMQRPKRQDFTIRNLGNNPMAETRNLFKQYEAIKNTVKK